jgi:DNA-binding response OmpR family regulator
MRVLVIEDDELVASGILAGLRLSGIGADHVANASQAEMAVQTGRFDVLLLDLGLPDTDGLTLLKRWRGAGKDWPVLVLTARDDVQDKVAGLRSGADDYLVKPFELDELVARLHALQRRSAGRSVDRIEHGPLAFDPATQVVTLDGNPVELSRRELALLQALLNSGQRILSSDQVKDSLYGLGDGVESNALNVHIYHLRRKLGPNIVETVRGLGYRLGKAGP